MKQRALRMLAVLAQFFLPPAHGENGGGESKITQPAPPLQAGANHDASADPFYRKTPIYATWIMIWNGSTEAHWWKPEDYGGCKVLVEGRWQSINWNDRTHIRAYFEAIKAAGINVIVVDFTNGFRWQWQAKYVQQLCDQNAMKFVIAFNPRAGAEMESGCRRVWGSYAAPEASHAGAYYYQDGKPLVVLYTWRAGYTNSIAQSGPYRQRFATAWASGEDSAKDKWGWQIEPEVGPVPSGKALFITGSVKFDSPKTSDDKWRKNLAWLDYGFLTALRSNPRVLIVGSFDDVHERNAWMVADTQGAKPGWQMRDISGALNAAAYYRRVSDWVTKGRPATCGGGCVRDGAYQAISSDGRALGVADNRMAGSALLLKPRTNAIDTYVWFYHLGDNEYRMIKLNAGLPLEAADGLVRITWDSDRAAQRWSVRKQEGRFRVTNRANNQVLDHFDGRVVTKPGDPAVESQLWSLVEICTLPQ